MKTIFRLKLVTSRLSQRLAGIPHIPHWLNERVIRANEYRERWINYLANAITRLLIIY